MLRKIERTNAKLVLYTYQKPTSSGFPIKVFINKGGRKRYWHTGYFSHPEHWDAASGRINRHHPLYRDFTYGQESIHEFMNEVERKIREIQLRNLSLEESLDFLENGESGTDRSFTRFAKKYLEDLKRARRAGTAHTYQTALTQFSNYMFNKEILFSDVTSRTLWNFRTYKEGQGVGPSAIHNYLRVIRTIWNHAQATGVVDKDKYPFYRGLMPTVPKTKKRAVEKEVMFFLMDLEITPNTMAWHSRNLFCLQFLLGGLDLADLAVLKREQLSRGRIRLTRHKVKNSPEINNLVVPEATRLLKPYLQQAGNKGKDEVFPMIPSPDEVRKYHDFRKKMNGWLNRLLKGTEYEEYHLTTKVARHTFSTAGQHARIYPDLLASLMGHEIRGHEILNVYKGDFKNQEKDEALIKIVERGEMERP